MKNIAVFASGNGSNFDAIIRAGKSAGAGYRVALLVCDNPKAPVIEKARAAGVRQLVVARQDFASREDFERKIIEELKKERVDLVVLAGFMRLLSPVFVREYASKIINIHPSLLPSFPGPHGIRDAFEYGVKITGVTVHFVDEAMDTGPVILQEAVRVGEGESVEELEKRIHEVEHRLYPEAIRLVLGGKTSLYGRKVNILP